MNKNMKLNSILNWIKKRKFFVALIGIVLIASCIWISYAVTENHEENSSLAVKKEKTDDSDSMTKDENDSVPGLDPGEDDASVSGISSSEGIKPADIYVAPAFFESDFDMDSSAVKEDPYYVQFPYAVPGTDLVITGLKSYDGVFIEDGSNEERSNVAALFLENKGDKDIEFVNIKLFGDTETYEFSITGAEAGSTVAAQEIDAKQLIDQKYSAADSIASEPIDFGKDENIEITENESGSLTVSNVGSEDIPVVRVFYKYYYPDQNAFLGGISFTAKITDLAAGESQTITPSHYQSGSSKITMVRTYTETE